MIQEQSLEPRGKFESLGAYNARLSNARMASLLQQLLELYQHGVQVNVAKAVARMGEEATEQWAA